MPSARPSLPVLVLALTLAAPGNARRAPEPAPLPPLVLPGAAPQISVRIAGQPAVLTVDFGGDPLVQLNPVAAARLQLAMPGRDQFRVAVGRVSAAVPFSRETLDIAGRTAVDVRVLTPAAPPPGQAAGSDGVIGLGLLPHAAVLLRFRAATAQDRAASVPARADGSSGSMAFAWTLAGQGRIEVELHNLRPASAASVAAASRIADAGDGRLSGPVRRVEIGFGVARPVRRLVLARPLAIAGVMLRDVDVRLFDWAGKAQLPPDADGAGGAVVTARRGRQRGWPILKLGSDVLSVCASIGWQRDPGERQRGRFELHCPA